LDRLFLASVLELLLALFLRNNLRDLIFLEVVFTGIALRSTAAATLAIFGTLSHLDQLLVIREFLLDRIKIELLVRWVERVSGRLLLFF
jgi:hypothetical protein